MTNKNNLISLRHIKVSTPTLCVPLIRKTGTIKLSSTEHSNPEYVHNFVQKAILSSRMQRFGPVNESSATSTAMKPKYSPKPSCSFWPDTKYNWSSKDQHAVTYTTPSRSNRPMSIQSSHTTSVCSTVNSVLEQAAPTNLCSTQIAQTSFSHKSEPGPKHTAYKNATSLPNVVPNCTKQTPAYPPIGSSMDQNGPAMTTKASTKLHKASCSTKAISTSPAASQTKGSPAKASKQASVSDTGLKRPADKPTGAVPCKTSKMSCPTKHISKGKHTKCATSKNVPTSPKRKLGLHEYMLECIFRISGEENDEFCDIIEVHLSRSLDNVDTEYFKRKILPRLHQTLRRRYSALLEANGLDDDDLVIVSVTNATQKDDDTEPLASNLSTAPPVSHFDITSGDGRRKRKYAEDIDDVEHAGSSGKPIVKRRASI